jgi:hypothetical protein
MRTLHTALIILCILLINVSGLRSQDKVSRDHFLEDCAVLKNALYQLHPGLFRYISSSEYESSYKLLIDVHGDNISLKEAFLRISEFLTSIKCGHTIANPNNQEASIIESVLNLQNKLPFTFSIVDKKMLVEYDVSNSQIPKGSEILTINNVKVKDILNELLKYSDGDGSNDGQRLYQCSLTGLGDFEFFDIYFPLLYPPVDGRFEISYSHGPVRKELRIQKRNTSAITRQERKERLLSGFGIQEKNFDEMWTFRKINDTTALLKIGTFVTYKMNLDWRKFLSDAFNDLNKTDKKNLIIDIRGNAGGTTEVAYVIASYLARSNISVPAERFVSYQIVPENLRPYLSTWDNSFYDRTGTVRRLNDRLYRLLDVDESLAVITPQSNGFRGKVYLIINEANSSATFILAKLLRDNKLATLVGQPTGGNLRGITGGQLFFLDLPNTKIEIDIPLITNNPDNDLPDSGLDPDIKVNRSVKDFIYGTDAELNHILKIED